MAGTDGQSAGPPASDGARTTLQQRLRLAFLTPRGWALFVAGAATLVVAWLLGRRELVNVSVFLLAAPLAAAAVVGIGKSRLHVRRGFSPDPVVAGEAARVLLEVTHAGRLPGGVRLTETLPERFGASPEFGYPSGTGAYQYRLKPSHRGVYAVGPLTARFTDPFGLATRPGSVDRAAPLTVVPPVARLEPNGVLGDRGTHGEARANRHSTPDTDDVMTREYRDGDSLRRVHWPATARHGSLMVRQEEYQSTPRATLLVDRRREPFNGSYLGLDEPTEVGNFTGAPGVTTPCFDWVVAAAAGIGSHLAGLGYAVDVLDQDGEPLAAASSSAPDPTRAVYRGPGAAEDLQLVLAAVSLSAGPPETGRFRRGADGGRRGADGPGRLAARVRNARNPLVLLTGHLSAEEASAWAEAVGPGRNAAAFLVTSRPSASAAAARVLRQAGWHPVAVDPDVPLAEAWHSLGAAERVTGRTATR
ncbi:MAG: DUF58 domain-containing protein [Arthrobacter sp.]|uniref:DUF58 domain-containing protein n=1 Tax=Arthrobacter sp. TaxID=1667 RepID=UPI003483AA38